MDCKPTAPQEEVREELTRVLSNKTFVNAARARRFLSYVVEETLNGRAGEIKELVLGIQVFDRSSDFDPRVDTIVRVEAAKLRKRLDAYYEKEGAGARIRINMPKGSYVPQFTVQDVREDQPPPVKRNRGPLYLAGLAGAGLLLVIFGLTRRDRPANTDPSIAVLPFLNLSPDPANEYFADGIAEELTDALAGLGRLRVASRTSAFFFKGKQTDVRDVGLKLGVAAVVEGSVRKDGDRVRITAQLVRTDNGYHLWSRSYDEDLKDILAVQEEIASAIAGTLEVKLAGNESQRLKGRTANVRAFDLYLKALSLAKPQTTAEAERLFQEAIAADPSFSKAYAALATTYLMGDFAGILANDEFIRKAKIALSKALSLSDEDAETHVAMGELAARFEFDWAAGERHLKRALEIDSNLASAHHQLAQNVLAPQSRFEEATAEQSRAQKLDPFNPAITIGGPWLLYLQRDYEGARKGFSAEMGGSNLMTLSGLGAVLAAMGRYDEALAAARQVMEVFPHPYTRVLIATSQARAGDIAGARKTLGELTALSKTRFVSPAAIAGIYIALNDADKAFEYMEQARAEHDSPVIFTRVEPGLDPIRKDPRFEKLLVEIGLSDKQIRERQAQLGSNYR